MSTQGSSFPGTSGSSSQEATQCCASLISSRKLKVTLLSCEWGSTGGGLSALNRELAIQLAKNDNVEVTMYLPWYSEEDKRAAAGFGVCLFKARETPGYDPIGWLASIPRDHHMDVVIGHGIHLGQKVPIIKYLQPACKWIQVVHTDPEELGMFKDYASPTVKSEKKHQAEVELCKLADQVVAVGPKLTEAFACYLRSCGKDQDVINLNPGIFSEFANINQAAEEREAFHVFVFGHGDSEDKFCVNGYDIAARAIAKLKDEERSFKLVFVGAPNGEEEKVKERFLEEGISPSQLIVRSAKEREQLAEQFYEADLVIMPSRTEGFGLAALEALSAGLPVLVSGNSGIGKALKNVPYGSNCVVESEKPKKWAKAIGRICHKQRKVRLKEAILLRQNYAETYQWEEQCSTLIERMLEMVKETSSVPDQAAAAVNLGEQGRSSISEAPFHLDVTTFQQQIVGDVLSSGRENAVQRKRPSHPIVTTTERRQQQNAGIPEMAAGKKPPQVKHKVKEAGDVPNSTETWSNIHLPIDILLLTVESCDFLRCFSLLDQPVRSYTMEIGPVYFGRMGDTSDQEKLKVGLIICSKGAAAPGGSLVAVLNAVRVLQPKAVFSVGTCISLDLEKVRMGDVVISSKLTTAEGVKTPGSPRLCNLVRDAPYGWVAPLENPRELEVKVHCDGDILSRSLREKCQLSEICELYPGAIAIETEGEGVYAAAYDANIEWVIVKGVASYFPQSQSAISEWMPFASSMAASVVAKILKDPTVFREWPHYNQGRQGVHHGASVDRQLLLREIGESFVKLIIEPSNLEKEKEEAMEKMLKEEVRSYLRFNDHSGHKFHQSIKPLIIHLINAFDVRLVTVGVKCVIIILQCPTLQSLEHLWNNCLSGHLDKVAERYLVTDEMKEKLNLETICLKTTIEQDDYLNCKKVLMELPSTCSDSLEHLWRDYLAGHLDKVAERYLVTNEIKEKLKLEGNCLKTTIAEENYMNCKKALAKLPSTCSETSTAPDQAVAAVNTDEQGPSSISETVVHPDLTTKQQHVVGDVLTSRSGNETYTAAERAMPAMMFAQGPSAVLETEEQRSWREHGETYTAAERAMPAMMFAQGPSAVLETEEQRSWREHGAVIDNSSVIQWLKGEYNRRAEFSPLLWSKGMKLQLKDLYARFSVVSSVYPESSEIGVDDIFSSSRKGEDSMVLLSGSPGIGKTFFCLKLAQDWANGAMPSTYPIFELVLLLKCKDIEGHIMDAISEQLLPSNLEDKTRENFLKFIEDVSNQERILVILDGWNELPEKSQRHLVNVLARDALPCCYVMVTTRELSPQFRFDIHLEMKGFSEDDSFLYIRKHFKSIGKEKSAKGERLIEEIKRNRLLQDLRSNRPNLFLLCLIYEDHEGELPSCGSELYQTLVRNLLRRYCAKQNLKADEEEMDLVKQCERGILALGELAWKCLLKNRHSFLGDELVLEISDEKSIALGLGLVYKEESLKRSKPHHVYTFVHKTFQEYLAASYIAHNLRGIEFDVLGQVRFPEVTRKFRQVFLFVCGMLRDEASIFFTQIGGTLQKEWDWVKCSRETASFFTESWKESGNAERMADTLFSFLPLPQVLHVDADQLEDLINVLEACKGFSKLQTPAEVHVTILRSLKLHDLIPLLRMLAGISNVKTLTLLACASGSVDRANVGEVLRASKTLDKVTFALSAGSGEGWASALDVGLGADSSLSSVGLRIYGTLTQSALQAVENLFFNKCLSSLSITVRGDLQESLANALARGLAGESAVKFLDLCFNGKLSFDGAYSLQDGILRNKSLRNLNLSVNGELPVNWQPVVENLHAQLAKKGVVSAIYPNTFSKVKDSQLTHLNWFLSKIDSVQKNVTLNVWGELSGDGCKAVSEVLLHAPVSHLTLNIHGQLTDEILRCTARSVEEQEKLSPITINAWVQMTEKESNLIKELGLDKNPSVLLNVCGTSAPLKESSDSEVISIYEPHSLSAFFEKAEKGSSKSLSLTIGTQTHQLSLHVLREALARSTSLNSLTLAINNYDDRIFYEVCESLGYGLPMNTSLKSLTLAINNYSETGFLKGLRFLGERLAKGTSLNSLTLAINNYSDIRVLDEWRLLGHGLGKSTSLNSLTLAINDYTDSNRLWDYEFLDALEKSESLTECNLIVNICGKC